MTGPEALNAQSQADTMMSVLNERLAAAVPVETLSSHLDRTLRVFEEPDGSRFVRRDFTDEAVSHVEEYPLMRLKGDLTFPEIWEAMEDLYTTADIDVIPSFVFRQEGDEHPFVIISEHVPGMVDVKHLPTEEKVKLVQGLGKLLKPEAEYWPSLEAIRPDTFKGVRQEDGTYRVLMVDTDPFVIPAPDFARDNFLAEYISKFSNILWDDWCNEEDRVEVAVALVMSLADSLTEEEFAGMDSLSSRAFMNLHTMSNGMDPRGTAVDMLSRV